MAFEGFPAEAFGFYERLGADNSRAARPAGAELGTADLGPAHPAVRLALRACRPTAAVTKPGTCRRRWVRTRAETPASNVPFLAPLPERKNSSFQATAVKTADALQGRLSLSAAAHAVLTPPGEMLSWRNSWNGEAEGMTTFLIRAAVPGDITALRDVFRSSSLSNDGDRIYLLAHPDALDLSDLAVTEGRTQAAVADGAIVGFATWLS